MFQLVLLGNPIPKGRPRFTRSGIAYTPPKTRAYEKRIATAAQARMGKNSPFAGALRVDVIAYIPLPSSMRKKDKIAALSFKLLPAKKPDIDNLAKAALDALNGIVWYDDSQICQLSIQKVYAASGRLEIKVGEIL